MRKVLSLFALFTIVISVTFLFSCNSGSFCCADEHTPTSQCSTCAPHIDSSYDTRDIHPTLVLTPSIIGHIFFKHINAEKNHVVFSFDRPPAILS